MNRMHLIKFLNYTNHIAFINLTKNSVQKSALNVMRSLKQV